MLRSGQLQRDPKLAAARPGHSLPGLRSGRGDRPDPPRRIRGRELGDALLDQRLLAGIGNVFKSEACFAAAARSLAAAWRALSDDELGGVIAAARELMEASVASGRPPAQVYGRRGEPCRALRNPDPLRGAGGRQPDHLLVPALPGRLTERGPGGR